MPTRPSQRAATGTAPLRPSQEKLLGGSDGLEMDDMGTKDGIATSAHKSTTDEGEGSVDVFAAGEAPFMNTESATGEGNVAPTVYKVYKRRWFGLIQLILLNIIVSWDWLTYSPVANTAAEFFDTTSSVVNWLSTSFLFSFCVACPLTYITLNKSGPKLSIMIAAGLLLLGNWIRYGGVRASSPSYGAVMLGQILIGFAQPFVLTAPTRYSDLWFSPRGRVAATAVASLANPFGGALGQLIDPFIATKASDIPSMTLYVAIISSVAAIPSFFIPARPPTPVAHSSTLSRPPIRAQISLLAHSATFWLLFASFATYVGFFNSLSSLLTQILTPYDFSESDSGIAGAILIVVGLVVAAVTSPLVDRYKRYLLIIKILVPPLALCYLAFIWAPPSRTIVAPYVVCAVLGATSFSLVPVVLEWAVEISYPVGPELTSVVLWAGGQLLGGLFIIVSDALMEGPDGNPPGNMHRALIFQAVIALAVAPCALAMGWVGSVSTKRLEMDKDSTGRVGRQRDDTT